ncbi:MAG: hypothetical protein ABIA11_03060 [Patescibacteria group bacterium]|nr:hypothetical protein [Patescibacteria group bacterium]
MRLVSIVFYHTQYGEGPLSYVVMDTNTFKYLSVIGRFDVQSLHSERIKHFASEYEAKEFAKQKNCWVEEVIAAER